MRQVVFSFFQYRATHVPSAFVLMGFQGLLQDKSIPPGMVRLMGCGSNDGFSIVPDLSTYCLVCGLSDAEDMNRIKRSRFYRLVSEPAVERLHFHLTALRGYGTWDGETMFDYSNRQQPEDPFVVLTRARVRASRMVSFWRNVPAVREHLQGRSGCCYAQGFGEHPLLSLATFSLWEDLEQMRRFAYQDSPHHETARLAMKEHWLSESIFARFGLDRVEGDIEHYPKLARLLSRRSLPASQAA